MSRPGYTRSKRCVHGPDDFCIACRNPIGVTTTRKGRVRIVNGTHEKIHAFDGPHHGRVMLLATVLMAEGRSIIVPPTLPEGERFGPPRSRPETYAGADHIYYVRRTQDGSHLYLQWGGPISTSLLSYDVPPVPNERVSSMADRLVNNLSVASFDHGVACYLAEVDKRQLTSNATKALANRVEARKLVLRYISSLEKELHIKQEEKIV